MSAAVTTRLGLIAALGDRRSRTTAAQALARDAGAEDLIVFVRDPEVDAPLPALGFPQTLPDGRNWRTFVRRCMATASTVEETLPYPDAASVRLASGRRCGGDAVLVLLGGAPRPDAVADLCAVMPLLAATFLAERAALVGETHAALARTRAQELEAIANTLASAQTTLQATLLEQRRLATAREEEARRKDEFLAILAHELRNPLAALSAATEVLRAGHLEESSATAALVLGRQVATLTRLLDDLLDLSRISRGVLDLRRTSAELGAIAAHALETARPVLDARRHHVTFQHSPAPLPVQADVVRLEQVILNVLTNAGRYTPEGGHITLTVRSAPGGRAEVRVRDDGVGIAPGMLDRIFDMFAQARGESDRAAGGLGIGLTISRRLAEMHGGTLTAASAGPGRGSEFVLTLPLAAPDPRPTSAPPESGPASRRPQDPLRILVVDDNRDNAEMTGALLDGWGHEVHVCYDSRGGPATRRHGSAGRRDLGPQPPGNGRLRACRGAARPARSTAAHRDVRLWPVGRSRADAGRRLRPPSGEAGGPRRAAAKPAPGDAVHAIMSLLAVRRAFDRETRDPLQRLRGVERAGKHGARLGDEGEAGGSWTWRTKGLTAHADRRLTTVLLENLIGNAWKFTGHQAQPRTMSAALETAEARCSCATRRRLRHGLR